MHKLRIRIKKNEGYCNKPYKDQLGNLTIGYGHLIKKSEDFSSIKKRSRKFLNKIFFTDLDKAISDFKKNYDVTKIPKHIQEVVVEMIFQLGINNVIKFNKFNKHIANKEFFMAALEMVNSRWYKQTPKRADLLIKLMLNNND